MSEIRLTEYSHGAGCGCKIAPAVLDVILRSNLPPLDDARLLVGNQSRDDAAVYDLGNGTAIISTTDFFMPIVDDPYTFGRIAATNAISDIYAMGGRPLLAIAIFGWPVDKLDSEIGRTVIEGGRQAAHDAGITIAGGHSIDAPEPIFGLAVTGIVRIDHLKQNSTARAGDRLYLTKPLGIGVLTTAQKKKLLKPEHESIAPELMCRLNLIGEACGALRGVSAMTDVTGFGLLGHLLEVCEGSSVCAEIEFARVPVLPEIHQYLAQGSVPGGTERNFRSYGHKVGALTAAQRQILCDPQTSGGLLVCVSEPGEAEFLEMAQRYDMNLTPIGRLMPHDGGPLVQVI
jgi:selenide,water dikinase